VLDSAPLQHLNKKQLIAVELRLSQFLSQISDMLKQTS
jgi:hypothetical protein